MITGSTTVELLWKLSKAQYLVISHEGSHIQDEVLLKLCANLSADATLKVT